MNNDSVVRCGECWRVQLVNFASCLATGWPRCHGKTMRLEKTETDIEKAVASVFAPADRIRKLWSDEEQALADRAAPIAPIPGARCQRCHAPLYVTEGRAFCPNCDSAAAR